MSFCSFIKGVTPKIGKFCFVLTNSVLLKLLFVWISAIIDYATEEAIIPVHLSTDAPSLLNDFGFICAGVSIVDGYKRNAWDNLSDFPSLISLMVSVDVKHHVYLLIWVDGYKLAASEHRGKTVRWLFSESYGVTNYGNGVTNYGSGVTNYGNGWRKDVVNQCFEAALHRGQELCESRGGRPGLPSLINLRFLWT